MGVSKSSALLVFTRCEDLKIINGPTPVIHGDDDQLVPIADSAGRSQLSSRKKNSNVYEKFLHGMRTTHAGLVNQALLAFMGGYSGVSNDPGELNADRYCAAWGSNVCPQSAQTRRNTKARRDACPIGTLITVQLALTGATPPVLSSPGTVPAQRASAVAAPFIRKDPSLSRKRQ